MTNLDKLLHIIGLAAGGLIVTAASGGIALPAWLMIVAGVVAPLASGTAGSPFKKADAPK